MFNIMKYLVNHFQYKKGNSNNIDCIKKILKNKKEL